MRRCVITCCLDKSDRIGIDKCYVFHCSAVSSSNIFGTAVSIVLYWNISPKLSRQIFFRAQKQLLQKYPMMTQWRNEIQKNEIQKCTKRVSMPIRSDLSKQRRMTQRRIGATGTLSVHCDTICPTGNRLLAIWSNLSRKRPSLCTTIRFVLLLKTVLHYDMICPDSCQSCL